MSQPREDRPPPVREPRPRAAARPAAHSRAAGATDATAKGGRKRRGWLWLLLVAVIAVVVLLIVLTQCGGDNRKPDTGSAPPPSAPSATAPMSSSQTPGQLNADGRGILPLSQAAGQDGALTSLVGKPVSGRSVPVQSVPAPEGFWVGQNATDRVWVKLLPQGDSPVGVKQGQLLDLDGKFVAHGADFAATQHVDAANGAEQLDRQRAHIEVSRDQPRVAGSR